jgi:hypothetical protein
MLEPFRVTTPTRACLYMLQDPFRLVLDTPPMLVELSAMEQRYLTVSRAVHHCELLADEEAPVSLSRNVGVGQGRRGSGP